MNENVIGNNQEHRILPHSEIQEVIEAMRDATDAERQGLQRNRYDGQRIHIGSINNNGRREFSAKCLMHMACIISGWGLRCLPMVPFTSECLTLGGKDSHCGGASRNTSQATGQLMIATAA